MLEPAPRTQYDLSRGPASRDTVIGHYPFVAIRQPIVISNIMSQWNEMDSPMALPVPACLDPLNPEVKLCNLPPFSAAATKLLQLSEMKDVDLRTVQPVLVSDPSLAAEVLRLANSPLFAFTNEIRSVEHAVVLLGLKRVKAIAVAIAMRHYSGGTDDEAYRRCWEHSLACAVIAEELAEFHDVRKEEGYTAGLLHDIGRVGLLKAYSKAYLPVLKTEYEGFEESVALEKCLLGINHCQSGSFLGKTWAFPRSLQRVAESHHSAASTSDSGLMTLIRISCALADGLGFPEVNYKSRPGIDDALQPLGDPAVARFSIQVSCLENRIRDKIAYFQTS
jgi:HD-like signal output (HDOD) protein